MQPAPEPVSPAVSPEKGLGLGKGWSAGGSLAHSPFPQGLPTPCAGRVQLRPNVEGASLQAFPLAPLPALGEPAPVPCPRLFLTRWGARAGRTARATVLRRGRESTGQGRAGAAGTADLTLTAVGVAPEAISARGGGCGMGTHSAEAERVRALSNGLSSADPGVALAPPLPPRNSWIGCWCGISPATSPPN